MNQKRAKAIRKYAVDLIKRKEAQDEKPLTTSYDMKISGKALIKYYRQYSVSVNHIHRIRRSIIRGERVKNMIGLPKQEKVWTSSK